MPVGCSWRGGAEFARLQGVHAHSLPPSSLARSASRRRGARLCDKPRYRLVDLMRRFPRRLPRRLAKYTSGQKLFLKVISRMVTRIRARQAFASSPRLIGALIDACGPVDAAQSPTSGERRYLILLDTKAVICCSFAVLGRTNFGSPSRLGYDYIDVTTSRAGHRARVHNARFPSDGPAHQTECAHSAFRPIGHCLPRGCNWS